MSAADKLAQVLAGHWSVSTHGNQDKCDGCGAVVHEWGQDVPYGAPHPLAHHQAAMILEALVSQAHSERVFTGSFPPVKEDAYIVAQWLRAKADEARA